MFDLVGSVEADGFAALGLDTGEAPGGFEISAVDLWKDRLHRALESGNADRLLALDVGHGVFAGGGEDGLEVVVRRTRTHTQLGRDLTLGETFDPELAGLDPPECNLEFLRLLLG